MLDQILPRTRADLAARMRARPLGRVAEGLARAARSLEAALRAARAGFILECKRASPSRGTLRADYDPAALARAYAWGADAVSVLTDAPFFQGAREHLRAVADAVDLPVLCKDFVVDPYQVYEARAHGADAILLMLSVLDDAGWRACAEACARLGMDALTEVHDADELARAVALGARIIGVNSRDLRTLRVDLATGARLLPQIPADRVRVAESGILTHADARGLRGAADAFLVGSAVSGAANPALASRQIICGRVKVCGLTRPEDAAAAWRAGASFGGLVFAPASARCVDEAQARAIRAAAPELPLVSVTVDEAPEVTAARARRLGLAAVQLHGDEPPGVIAALGAALPQGCELWRAHRVQGGRLPTETPEGVERLVLDAHAPHARGGTGQRFDWTALRDHPARHRWLVAGGLDPDNAAEADALGAWALDVSSGLERAPGVKDPARITAFFSALRGAGRPGAATPGAGSAAPDPSPEDPR